MNKDDALIHAASSGDLETVKSLLAGGCDINRVHSVIRYTALHGAADHGKNAVLAFLIRSGADLSPKRERTLETPLHWAAANGRVRCVSMLLEAGAEKAPRNEAFQRPLDLALEHRRHDVVVLLREPPSNLCVPEQAETTPTSMIVHWKVPDHNGAPVVEYELTTVGNGETNVITEIKKPQLLLSDLKAATDYICCYKALNAAGWSVMSNTSTLRTCDDIPNVPSLLLSGLTATAISVEWIPPCCNGRPIDQYEIQVQLQPDDRPYPDAQLVPHRELSEWETASVFSAEEASKCIRCDAGHPSVLHGPGGELLAVGSAWDLLPGCVYKVRGRAHNNLGWSDWSESTKEITTHDAPVFHSNTSSSITITWSASALSDIDLFEVQYRKEWETDEWMVASKAVKECRCTIKDLTPGLRYVFRVRAHSFRGWAPFDDAAQSNAIPTAEQIPECPAPPSTLLVWKDGFLLGWRLPWDNGAIIDRFSVEQRCVTMTGVGTEEEHRVNEEWAEFDFGEVSILTVEELEVLMRAELDKEAVTFVSMLQNEVEEFIEGTIDDSSMIPASFLKLEKELSISSGIKRKGICQFDKERILTDPMAQQVCVIRRTGLLPGVRYQFRLKVGNKEGWSEMSIIGHTSRTQLAVPFEPKAKLLVCGRNTAKFRWELPRNNGAPVTAYEAQAAVLMSSDECAAVIDREELLPSADSFDPSLVAEDDWFVLSDSIPGDSTDFTARDISPGTSFGFRMRAINSLGGGLWWYTSPGKTTAIAPCATSSPTALTIGPTRVQVAWKLPCSNGATIDGNRLFQRPITVRAKGAETGGNALGGWIKSSGVISVMTVGDLCTRLKVEVEEGEEEEEEEDTVHVEDLLVQLEAAPSAVTNTLPGRLAALNVQDRVCYACLEDLSIGIRFELYAQAKNEHGWSSEGEHAEVKTEALCPDAPVVKVCADSVASLSVTWRHPFNNGFPVMQYEVDIRPWEVEDTLRSHWRSGCRANRTVPGMQKRKKGSCCHCCTPPCLSLLHLPVSPSRLEPPPKKRFLSDVLPALALHTDIRIKEEEERLVNFRRLLKEAEIANKKKRRYLGENEDKVVTLESAGTRSPHPFLRGASVPEESAVAAEGSSLSEEPVPETFSMHDDRFSTWRVARSVDGTCSSITINQLDEGEALHEDTHYVVRVRAVNSVGSSEYGRKAAWTHPQLLRPPQKPQSIVALPRSISLVWMDSARMYLERAVREGDPPTDVKKRHIAAYSQEPLAIPPCVPDRAFPPPRAPPMPSLPLMEPTDRSPHASRTALQCWHLQYRAAALIHPRGEWMEGGLSMPVGCTGCTIPGLTPATSYRFRLRVFSELGWSDFGEESDVLRTQNDVPAAPLSPEIAHRTDCIIRVSWNAPSSTHGLPVEAYCLQMRQGGSGADGSGPRSPGRLSPRLQEDESDGPMEGERPKYSMWTSLTDTLMDLTYMVVDLLPVTTYQFRVAAKNGLGWSEFSEPSKLARTRRRF